MVPAPPHIARQRPQPLLRRGDEAVQSARLADHRRHLAGRLHQHANLVFAKDARLLGLHHQHALQNAAIDQRNAQEGVVLLFARLPEVFEARMIAGVLHGHGQHLLGHQAGQALMQRHAQRADASRMQAEGRGQHQVGAVGFQQIGGADVGPEAPGDQRDHVHQRVGRLAALLGEVGDLLQRQNVTGISSS